MLKRKNKKGFTLAELLIVVAIIAVLVAIAVPLFVGALNDAEARVGEADCRAVRGAAVEEILLNSQRTGGTQKDYGNGPWLATAEVSKDGEVGDITITIGSTLTETTGTKIGDTAIYSKTEKGYKVQVLIKELTGKKGE